MELTHPSQTASGLMASLFPRGRAARRYVAPLAFRRPGATASPSALRTRADLPSVTADALQFLTETMFVQFVEPALRSGSGKAYLEAIHARWGEYRETLDALHVFLARAISEERAVSLAERSAEDAVTDLRAAILEYSGETAAEEVAFAGATYLRAVRLASRIGSLGDPSDADRDVVLCRQFHNAGALHVFGIASACALTSGVVVEPDVASKVFELLRVGALDAYVAAREALDLRLPPEAEPQLPLGDADEIDCANELAESDVDEVGRTIDSCRYDW